MSAAFALECGAVPKAWKTQTGFGARKGADNGAEGIGAIPRLIPQTAWRTGALAIFLTWIGLPRVGSSAGASS